MVRSDRNYPDVYFGRPGQLIKMPWPRAGLTKPFDRQVYDFLTGSGMHQVSSLIGGSRQYTVAWRALHADNHALLGQYWTGSMGQGPWVFIDPSILNMLLPNQASATNLFADTRNFTVTLGALSSNSTATQVHRTGATRSLRWLFASAPGVSTPTLTLSPPYRSWYGHPVVPGLDYRFSAWLKPDGVIDTSITAAVKLRWLTAAGADLTLLTSGDTPVTAWQRLSTGGVAPAGAAYVRPTVVLDGSTVAAGGSLYVDELLLEQDTVVNNWAPGTGLRPVEMLDLTDAVPFNARFREGVTMTLRELAQ